MLLTCVQLIKQVWLLPETILNAFRTRERPIVLDVREAERLDRLRNPAKYRGK
jgi:hypothetical protein